MGGLLIYRQNKGPHLLVRQLLAVVVLGQDGPPLLDKPHCLLQVGQLAMAPPWPILGTEQPGENPVQDNHGQD